MNWRSWQQQDALLSPLTLLPILGCKLHTHLSRTSAPQDEGWLFYVKTYNSGESTVCGVVKHLPQHCCTQSWYDWASWYSCLIEVKMYCFLNLRFSLHNLTNADEMTAWDRVSVFVLLKAMSVTPYIWDQRNCTNRGVWWGGSLRFGSRASSHCDAGQSPLGHSLMWVKGLHCSRTQQYPSLQWVLKSTCSCSFSRV